MLNISKCCLIMLSISILLTTIAEAQWDEEDSHSIGLTGSSYSSSDSSDEWYTPYGIADDKELESPASVYKLIRALESGDEDVQIKAIRALEDIGPDAKAAVPYLVDLLSNENWKFRYADVKAILKIDPSNEPVSRGLQSLLIHQHPKVRIRALQIIQEVGYFHPEITKMVKDMADNDPHRKVKIIADRTWRSLQSKKLLGTQINVSIPKSDTHIIQKDAIYNIPNFYSVPRENDYAVIIGIENYQNISQKSDYSYNDAKLVKEYLKALGLREGHIDFLANERATASGIRKSIEAWLPNNVKKDSKVFIYYSGHGAPNPKGKGYFVPYDGDPNYLEFTGYSLDRFYANLAKIDCDEIIVVIDSCFSGAGGRSVLPTGARPVFIEVNNPILSSKKIAVLSSSKMNQISTSYSEKQLGLFTYHFLSALKENKMTVVDIYNYIKPKVEDNAKSMNIEQSPSLLISSSVPHDKFSIR